METHRYEEYLKKLYIDNSEHYKMFEELLDDYIEAIETAKKFQYISNVIGKDIDVDDMIEAVEKLRYISHIIDKGIDVDDMINEIQSVIQGDTP